MVILNARDHGEIIKAFQEGREDTLFIAATEAEKLIEQEDIVVGILHAIQDNDITEKPWNGLGLYYVLLIDESISYISKTKKNMGTEVILLSFSDFVENAELH
ncbi:MAG: hypothetical protein LBG22_05910 [Treponema sp.]|jgi:hypothetical protein|nr:hypothetical protein [Treponema sp.]